MVRKTVIAVATSDWHLSSRPPIARCSESNWFDCMKYAIGQVNRIAARYNVPVILAGDLFNKWDSSAELINFAMDVLPGPIIAVPGQHDLPYHDLKQMHRSAYGTLCKTRHIDSLSPTSFAHDLVDCTTDSKKVKLHGYAWGEPIKRPKPLRGCVYIAVVHKYIWIDGHSFLNAPASACICKKTAAEFKGYSVVISGDNHKGFVHTQNGILFINCGSLMRRAADQADYKPFVTLLHDDLTATRIFLDVSQDQLSPVPQGLTKNADLEDFFEQLHSLHSIGLDFQETIKNLLVQLNPSKAVQRIIHKAINYKDIQP